jgi:hypothetical protein
VEENPVLNWRKWIEILNLMFAFHQNLALKIFPAGTKGTAEAVKVFR